MEPAIAGTRGKHLQRKETTSVAVPCHAGQKQLYDELFSS
jgi:hypothetical protein